MGTRPTALTLLSSLHVAAEARAVALSDRYLWKVRFGFSLVELLVVLSIVGLLLALTLPAIQRVRESARRVSCQNRMRQIGLAIQDWHGSHGYLPPDPNRPFGFGNYIVAILPYLEQQSLFDSMLNTSGQPQTWNDNINDSFFTAIIPELRCPSDYVAPFPKRVNHNPGNYVASTGTWYIDNTSRPQSIDGAFGFVIAYTQPHPVFRFSEFTDGLAQTALLSEALAGDASDDCRRLIFNVQRDPDADVFEKNVLDACRSFQMYGNTPGNIAMVSSRCHGWWDVSAWNASYNHLLLPNTTNSTYGGSVAEGAYSASSDHLGVVNLVFADGHLQPVSETIDKGVWRAIGTRSGNESVSIPD